MLSKCQTFANYNDLLVKIHLTPGQPSCFRLLNPDWAIHLHKPSARQLKSNIPLNSKTKTCLYY